MEKAIYTIDGNNFTTLEGFFGEVSRALIPGIRWGHNLDAFNDILRGGFGTPEEGFILRWKNSEISKARLGYPETVRQLEKRLTECHPTNSRFVSDELSMAERDIGPTVFDWLVEIIKVHAAGGPEAEDGVELVLE